MARPACVGRDISVMFDAYELTPPPAGDGAA
jgi:hypothetical protein